MQLTKNVATTTLAILVTFSATANADVMDSAENGFHIKIVAEVDAPKDVAYQQFLRVAEWWNADHTWFGDAKNLSIEPRAGGCFCEKKGDQSVLHMVVSFVKPGETIKMLGGLGPLQELGLSGAMFFQFEELAPNRTRITHEYRVTGYMKGGLQQLAAIVDGVQTEQVAGLKAKLEE